MGNGPAIKYASSSSTTDDIINIKKGITQITHVYAGSDLVWRVNDLPIDTVIANTQVAGSATIYYGTYELKIAGAGGTGYGEAVWWGNNYYSGGSGAVWEGTFKWPGGPTTFSWTSGTGEEASVTVTMNGQTMLIAGGGKNASNGRTGGTLTVESAFNQYIQTATISTDGTIGDSKGISWGSSYSGTTASASTMGWGIGADSSNNGRTDGGLYLKLVSY